MKYEVNLCSPLFEVEVVRQALDQFVRRDITCVSDIARHLHHHVAGGRSGLMSLCVDDTSEHSGGIPNCLTSLQAPLVQPSPDSMNV